MLAGEVKGTFTGKAIALQEACQSFGLFRKAWWIELACQNFSENTCDFSMLFLLNHVNVSIVSRLGNGSHDLSDLI